MGINYCRRWRAPEHTGELVAKFKWPINQSIETVKNGFAYALETDMETGQQTVVKYAIKIYRG